MKSVIFLILVLMIMESSRGQIVPSDCTPSDVLVDYYTWDVRNLTLQRMFGLNSPDTALVRIPQAWQDTIMEGMAAISNAVPVPERDSVFNLYCVHDIAFSQYSITKELMVSVDTAYEWTQAWQNLVTLTGDPMIDTIVTRYALEVSEFYNWSFANVALLATDSLWNIYALIDSLEAVPGVIYAEPNYLLGTAGKILYQKAGADRTFEFWFEWNDCFDGCDNAHAWKFKVYEDCSVEYLGFEDWWVFNYLPLPLPLNCNLFSAANQIVPEPAFRVFPNPASDRITLIMNDTRRTGYFLTDPAGRTLRSGSFDGQTVLDISELPAGYYMLQLEEGGKHFYQKVLKR
jgi:hypothetical protein